MQQAWACPGRRVIHACLTPLKTHPCDECSFTKAIFSYHFFFLFFFSGYYMLHDLGFSNCCFRYLKRLKDWKIGQTNYFRDYDKFGMMKLEHHKWVTLVGWRYIFVFSFICSYIFSISFFFNLIAICLPTTEKL